jgi:hypothetical protein
VPQAILALGVCCEVEVQSLTQEIIATKDEPFQRLFEDHARLNFRDAIGKLIENLGGEPFGSYDADATKLVLSLYEMRGQVAHRGACMGHDGGKHAEVGFKELASYVQAVEKLFTWSERQRELLLRPGSCESGPSSE